MRSQKTKTTNRSQPSELMPPGLAHPTVSNLPLEANRAALDMVNIFAAPADMPNLGEAIINAGACLHLAILLVPEAMTFVMSLHQGFQSYLNTHLPTHPQTMSLAGRKIQNLQWDLITRKIEEYHDDVKTLIGLELINAYLLQKAFPANLAKNINSFVASEPKNIGDSAWIGKKLTQSLQSVGKIVRSRIKGLTTEEVRLNHTLNSFLMVLFGFGNVLGNQAAGGKTELLAADYMPLFSELRLNVENGDYQAALRCTAFCLGLSTPIAEMVPFRMNESCAAVIYLCAERGVHYCSLHEALDRLAAKAPEGSVPTSKELWRPFPEFLASFWKKALANNPEIAKVGDAGRRSRSKYVTRIDSAEISAGIPISEARLIASRGSVFLHSGVQRDDAAFAALAPYLLDKSDFHYIYKTPEEVWAACDQAFQYVGWGNAVPLPEEFTIAVGTLKSPEEDVVRKKIASTLKAAQSCRAGKNSLLASVASGHNAFIFYVALMMYLTFGGRNRTIVSYKASAWNSKNPFGVHIDKPESPNQSRLHSPIPTYLAVTLKYLHTHYQKLDDRLEKSGVDRGSTVRIWIKKILNGEEVNLLFKFDKRMLPRDLRLRDVLGNDDELGGDAFRHFIPKALELANVPFEYFQAWLKHHSAGNSANSVTSRTPPVVWLSCVAAALNDIARRLGLVPCHGISKG